MLKTWSSSCGLLARERASCLKEEGLQDIGDSGNKVFRITI
jgi:hypothetical protein